jgi:multidrug efflux system membrane fusion protein
MKRAQQSLAAMLRCTVCLLAACAVFSACSHKPPTETDTAPPTVTVSLPVAREVTDFVEFVGRIEAPLSLEVRARVTGYLVKMPFKEGSLVKTGDVLFEIDDRMYKDELDHAQASLDEMKAALVKAQAFLDIGLETQKISTGAISQQEIVQRRGARDESQASVLSAEATLRKCQLNYEWCKVTSAIDGRVSRYNLTLGNLADQDTTVLTTVVSEDPLYAYFDVDERTLLGVLRLNVPGNKDVIAAKSLPVMLGLADEEGFPHTGYVDFANNVVNSATGTVTVRGVFANPFIESGRRLMRPGMFVRVRLPVSQPHQALLVSEKALATDQGQKFVYVVDSQNAVQYRRVTVGASQSDGLRVINQGLKADDLVLISGLQLVRPRQTVKPERASMLPASTPDKPAAGEPAAKDASSKEAASKGTGATEPASKDVAPDAAGHSAKTAPSDHP